jgi:hypothetical protein
VCEHGVSACVPLSSHTVRPHATHTVRVAGVPSEHLQHVRLRTPDSHAAVPFLLASSQAVLHLQSPQHATPSATQGHSNVQGPSHSQAPHFDTAGSRAGSRSSIAAGDRLALPPLLLLLLLLPVLGDTEAGRLRFCCLGTALEGHGCVICEHDAHT